MSSPDTHECTRCGAPITAASSVGMPDGMTCLRCLASAAKTDAPVLAQQRLTRRNRTLGLLTVALIAGFGLAWMFLT